MSDEECASMTQEIHNFFHDEDYWRKKDNLMFKNVFKCYRVTLRGFEYLSLVANSLFVQEWDPRSTFSADLFHVPANPRSFLNDKTNGAITEDIWCCDCKKNFLHSRYIDTCSKCECSQNKPNNRVKYIEPLFKGEKIYEG